MKLTGWLNKTPRTLAILLTALLALSACGDEPKTIKSNNSNNSKELDAGDEYDADNQKQDTNTPDIEKDANVNNEEDAKTADQDVDGNCLNPVTYYADADGDGFGDDSTTVNACATPESGTWVTVGGDCDDTDAAIHPDADEVCDGVDNNCDGHIDSGAIIAQNCQLQKGVCSGATTTTCSNGDYAACAVSNYGPDYTSDADEARMCDGLDNNCDGTVDSVCCGVAGNNSEPKAVNLGVGSNFAYNNLGPSRPTVVEAATGAPVGATALVVWDESPTKLIAQHIDRDGKPVGPPFTQTVTGATTATVVTTPLGYDLIWGEAYARSGGKGSSKIKVQPLKAGLTKLGSPITIETKAADPLELLEITAAYHDRGVMVGINSVALGQIIGAVLYRIDDRANSAAPLNIGSGGLFGTAYMRTFSIKSGLLLTWYSSGGALDKPKFNGKLYSSTGIASGSFQVEFERQDAGQYDVIQTKADEIMVVYPEARGTNKALVAATINLTNGNKIKQVDLTASTSSHLSPAIVARDTNNNGFPDETTVIWVIKGPSSTTLVGSSFDAQNLAPLTSESIIAPGVNSLDNTNIIISGNSAVALWQTRDATQRIRTAPLSLEGHGLCL